jgi:alkylhydroperoxidase family enzyme
MAHSRVLVDRFHDTAEVRQIVTDPSAADVLDDTDRAVMAFAAQVARDATSVTADDVAALRSHGLDDGEVLDVAIAAAARSFFAKVVDAVGAEPDAALAAVLGPDLTAANLVGRPVEAPKA